MPERTQATQFPREPMTVLASYFDGGAGPSHNVLAGAIASVGIDDANWGGSKTARIMHAYAEATVEQQYSLADELLLLIRNDHGFRNSNDWTRRAKAAFAHAGARLDDDGYATWAAPVASPVSVPSTATRRPASRMPHMYSVGDAIAAVSSVATASVDVVEDDDEDPQIFLVHGHDEAARNEVEVFLTRTTGITPVVLMLEPSRGRTIIEKFEEYADRSSFAVILMTPDDLGRARSAAGTSLHLRPRQNVVFEFGYFVGALRRAHVAALVWPQVERPSDIDGLVYIDHSRDWKEQLRVELREAGIPIIR